MSDINVPDLLTNGEVTNTPISFESVKQAQRVLTKFNKTLKQYEDAKRALSRLKYRDAGFGKAQTKKHKLEVKLRELEVDRVNAHKYVKINGGAA